MKRAAKFFIGALVYFGLIASASAERRVALVIGNSDYEHTATLKNPINDAIDMAAKLNQLGFKVIRGLNLDYMDLQDKMRRFTNEIERADVALFFYAGHGLQVEGRNYLIPVSASLNNESDVDFQTVPLNLILRQMARQKRTNLVFLDACRNNPLANAFARKMRSASKTRSTGSTAVGRGLARVESGLGMLISYATSPGDVALDGDGRNSPYTTALLQHMETPGVNINDLMISVRQDVLKSSRGQQIPWENSSLLGHFYFKERALVPTIVASRKNQTAPVVSSPQAFMMNNATSALSTLRPAPKNDPQLMIAAFEATRSIGTCGSYRAFQKQFSDTFYAVLANEWITKNCRVKQPSPTVAPLQKHAALEADNMSAMPSTIRRPETYTNTPSSPPELNGRQLVLSLQRELKRVGCASGKTDGVWGRKSIKAITAYNKAAGARLSTGRASMKSLLAIRTQRGSICRKASRSVRTCPAGQFRSRKGNCLKHTSSARRKTARTRTEPAETPESNNNINIFRNNSKNKKVKKVFGNDDNPNVDLGKLAEPLVCDGRAKSETFSTEQRGIPCAGKSTDGITQVFDHHRHERSAPNLVR